MVWSLKNQNCDNCGGVFLDFLECLWHWLWCGAWASNDLWSWQAIDRCLLRVYFIYSSFYFLTDQSLGGVNLEIDVMSSGFGFHLTQVQVSSSGHASSRGACRLVKLATKLQESGTSQMRIAVYVRKNKFIRSKELSYCKFGHRLELLYQVTVKCVLISSTVSQLQLDISTASFCRALQLKLFMLDIARRGCVLDWELSQYGGVGFYGPLQETGYCMREVQLLGTGFGEAKETDWMNSEMCKIDVLTPRNNKATHKGGQTNTSWLSIAFNR